MSDLKKKLAAAALAKDGMTLEDYEPGSVIVVVAGEVLADSETMESGQALVDRARGYGDDAFLYEV